MKRWNQVFAFVLVCVSSISLGGCGSGSEKSASENKGNQAYDKVVYAFVSFNTIPTDVSKVEEAINVLTREKIGVEVVLKPLSISNYEQQVSLAMQGGEPMDIFHSLGNFSQYLTKKQAYDITGIIDQCAPEAKAIVGEKFLSTTTKDSKIYGIPAYKAAALQPQFIYWKEIADELGLDFSNVTKVEDLEPILQKVKEAHPNITPLATINAGDTGIVTTMADTDYLSDDWTYPKGVLVGDSTTVVDLFSTDVFKSKIQLMRDWNQKGYISKDAATNSSIATELISAGTAFSFMGGYGYAPEDTAVAISHQTGKTMGAVKLGDPYLDTSALNAITWMIGSTTKNSEAALKFLNLTYSDPDVLNLIIYGIEGEDYVKTGDNEVKYPEGLDASTVPYTAQLSCGIVGNQFKQYVMEGTMPEALEKQLDMVNTAKTSKALGFMFDNAEVKTEYSSVINVLNEYLPGLRCGSLDPETELPKFISKLNAAGLDKVIAAKQAQLDVWLESQK